MTDHQHDEDPDTTRGTGPALTEAELEELDTLVEQLDEEWEEFRETRRLAALVGALQDRPEAPYAERWQRFQEGVAGRLAAMRVADGVSGELVRDASRLLPFAPFCPAILLEAGRICRAALPEWAEGLIEELSMFRRRSLRSTLVKLAPQMRRYGVPLLLRGDMEAVEVAAVARRLLQEAWDAGDEPVAVAAAHALGELWESEAQPGLALEWYGRASATAAIQRLEEQLREQAVRALFEQVDQSLSAGAGELLEPFLIERVAQAPTRALQVRLADLQYLQGALPLATAGYQAALDGEEGSGLDALSRGELEQLATQLTVPAPAAAPQRPPPFQRWGIDPSHYLTRAHLGRLACAMEASDRAKVWQTFEELMEGLGALRTADRGDLLPLAGLQDELRRWEAALLRDQAAHARSGADGAAQRAALAELHLLGEHDPDEREALADGNAPPDTVRRAAAPPARPAPFILIRPLGHAPRAAGLRRRRPPEAGWAAYAGVQLSAVWTPAQPVGDMGAQGMARLLLFLNQHFTHFGNVDVVWRYLSQDGQLTIALLCRCRATSAVAARRQAEILLGAVQRLLPLRDTIYTYVPLASEAALRAVLEPFEVRGGFEVARRVRRRAPGRAGEGYVLPLSLQGPVGSLQMTLQALLEAPAPSLLDVRVSPTTMSGRERRRLAEIIRREQRRHPQPRETLESVPPLLETLEAGWTLAPLLSLLEASQSSLFTVRAHLATAAAESPLELAFLAAMELLGPGSRVVETLTASECAALMAAVTTLGEEEHWVTDSFPEGLERLGELFTLAETTAVVRLPLPTAQGLPGVARQAVAPHLAPTLLPAQGVIVGEALHASGSTTAVVRLGDEARVRHTCLLGRTGTGKSTLMLNLVLQDIERGRGVAVIDPHSQLIDKILERLPPERLPDVVLFDPSDMAYPLGYNVLDVAGPAEANAVIGYLIATFRKLYDPHSQGIVGPRFENILRNTMLALFEGLPGATLIDVMHFVMSESLRDRILPQVQDPLVRGYWAVSSAQMGSWGEGRGELVDWVISKFSSLVNDLVLRPIVGQPRTSLDLAGIMNHRKILLVDLCKGKIGPEVSQFLGLILVSGIFQTLLARAKAPAGSLPPFFLYIDEFQNITTPHVTEMFSEARKFGLGMTVANQHFSQLSDGVRQSIIGNVANWLVFQVGVDDSAYLQAELYPTTREELIRLPAYHAYAKLLVEGGSCVPFPLRTLDDDRTPDPALAARVRAASQRRYGRHWAPIHEEIRQHFEQMFRPA